ncbi:hypothetical protein SAMN05443144_10656 [Fodinibius roseus]|uniref:Uncharacterized protein n=1 Tax=Fodinibius roseus TaxID=1194090 RepID=A0A1M4ZLG5_9BACT|nr:contractile injection system tape measure protein [Fodinibius roseus]SHF18406.1 hypothetical protein SAMN05443144_10656 [Fodinibius roseus]
MDLHLAERSKADPIRDRVSTICREQIIPALSEICDKLTENQEQLFLNRLELDLGVIPEDELEQVLVSKLVDTFEEQIKELILNSDIDSGMASLTGKKEQGEDSTSRSRVDVLMHYFRRGTIPWWCPYPGTDIRGWIEEQFSEDARSFLSAIERELGSPAVRGRVIRHFSDAQFRRLFEARQLTEVFRFYESVRQAVRSEPGQTSRSWKTIRNVFLDALLERVGGTGSSPSTPSSSGSQPLSDAQKKRVVAGAVYLLVEEQGLSRKIIDAIISDGPPGISLFSDDEWERAFDEFDSSSGSRPADTTKDPPPKADIPSGPTGAKEEDQFIEIQNAGLVLVWPYLNKLFEHLDFVEEGAFVSDPATHRAVHLLHFIAAGHEEGEEHKWPLNKLLCGLEPEGLVPEDIELSDREKEEAVAMVKSTIDHWKALKNTSVGGFRETFLQRQGILRSDPHGWKVEIERITYDILLDKLPWPISVINLPWNEEVIHVQW